MNLKTKLFFLIFFTVLFTLLVSSYFYYKNVTVYFKDVAYADTRHELEIFSTTFDNLKKELVKDTRNLASNYDISSSLNLISNYQDIEDYEKILFDEEKKTLLSRVNSSLYEKRISIIFFDKNKNLVAFKKNDGDLDQEGYVSFEHKKEKIIFLENNKKQFLFKPLDEKNINKIAFFIDGDNLIVKFLKRVYSNSEHVGYIRVAKRVNSKNFYTLLENINNKFWLLSEELEIGNDKYNEINVKSLKMFSENEFIEAKDNFIHFQRIMTSKDFSLYAVSGYSKDKLEAQLRTLYRQIITVVIVIFFITIIVASLFSRYYLTSTFNNLIESIKKIKNKNYEPVILKNSDETEEIVKEFNSLTLDLQNNLIEKEETNILLQNMINNIPMGIFIKNVDAEYIKVNKFFMDIIGVEDEGFILGKKDEELSWSEESLKEIKESDYTILTKKESQLKYESEFTRKDKTLFLLKSKVPLKNKAGITIGILGIFEDMTEQKKTQKELQEKEKYMLYQNRLAQMGEMINMIAHQWRQPLSAISSTANGLKLKVVMDNMQKDYFETRLDNVLEYTSHLSSTIDDFRNFFKKNKEKTEVSIEDLVNDSLKIIYNSIQSKNITVDLNYNSFKKIFTYANEVRQVILNLLKNAEDILSEKDIKDPKITIKTFDKDDNIVLEILDNGGGIPEDIIDKVFEPYFSTKTNKDGTGLGLYMSKAIIDDHCNGKIEVKNTKCGAMFRIVL